ncbi:DUF4337 family protein, partial [Siccirubricoccus deserti]
KRRLGSALSARSGAAQAREIILRVLTHNLMLLRSPTTGFQQCKSEPETREGRRELMERARAAEAARDRAMHEDRRYDTAAALLQVGIVLASAGIITGMVALAWAAGLLGLGGAALSALTHTALL